MADFNDVATNAEILRIAEAIRVVTRTAEGMTIPEMPDRLMGIRVVECKDVQVELNTQGEVLLGVFDKELKHMFVVTPYADQDNDAVNAASVQRALIFDQGTGSLYLHEEVKTDLTARFIVIDFLLASDQTSGGVMLKGQKGDKGEKGDKGDTGAQGPRGEQGIQGEKGDKGDKGDTGAKGDPGAKGDKGDTGDTPYIGANGNWWIGNTDTGKPSRGATGATGANGTSVTVSSVSESTADGGENVVTFSDGKTLTVKNGSKGSQGIQGIKGNNGTDGVSPTVETETIAGGTKVTITDKDGANEFDVMNGVDGESAYQIATEHGYTGTESEWVASLHAANPKVLPMSQYETEAEAIAYMDSQTDHSIIYVWNNKVYCNASKTVTQLTGACLYGYRNSASSGVVAADGKSMYVIPVSSFATPLTISDYTFPISNTPYIYGGTVIPTFNVDLIQNDSWIGKTDAFDISAEQLQGCSYVVFAVTTSTQPSEVSVTVNGTVVPLSVITSPSQISEVVGTKTITVDGYVDSGVIYTAIISSSSTKKYVNDRNSYILPVPYGYCESHATYEAGTHYLTKYPYETMTGMFSALATANSAYITETTLGKDQSNTYDIKSYILDAPSSLASGQTSAVSSEKPVFIITSGLHGLEPDAVHMVYHFMQDLSENFFESEQLQYLHDNIKFVIIPICNPWGYVNQTYNNSRDVDINKNFESGYRTNGTANTGTAANSEAETLLMKQVFDEYSKAIFHLECHGKYGVDTAFNKTIWFSLMKTLASELIELNANKLNSQIGKRLYNLGYQTNKSTGGYITYFGLNGRPKDYTGTKYGILSATMEDTGCIYGETGYSVNTQKINCEALENFVLNVIDSLGSKVKVRNTDNEDTIASLDWYNGEVM